jgi:hypothetical protein
MSRISNLLEKNLQQMTGNSQALNSNIPKHLTIIPAVVENVQNKFKAYPIKQSYIMMVYTSYNLNLLFDLY